MAKDFWKAAMSGDKLTIAGIDRPVSIADIEVVAHALANHATLDWHINSAPDIVEAAVGDALIKANDAIKAFVRLAEVSRNCLAQRDGPFPETDDERQEREDKEAADLAARSAHRPPSRITE